MRGHGAGQAVEVVATLQQRDDAAFAGAAGDVHQAPRRPGEIRFDQIEMAERDEAMGVESRRDDDQVRPETFEARQKRDIEGLAERCAAVAGAQWRVDDLIMLAALVDRASAGKERHLMGRAIHRVLVAPENVLRAVAVMDVEINNGDALGAMDGARVARRDRSVVEEAEAHRRLGLGVMARRAHRDESVGAAPAHHRVDGARRSARGATRRLERSWRHRRVGVEATQALLRRGALDRGEIRLGMDAQQRLAADQRRRLAREQRKALLLKRPLDRLDALRAFGMAIARVMVERRWMREQDRRHGVPPLRGVGRAALQDRARQRGCPSAQNEFVKDRTRMWSGRDRAGVYRGWGSGWHFSARTRSCASASRLGSWLKARIKTKP